MRKLNWILQSNLVKQEHFDKIKSALQQDGISYEEVKVIPFSDNIPEVKCSDCLNIFYGTTTLVLNAYREVGFREGIFMDEERFNFKKYLEEWGSRMLNGDSFITTFPELVTRNYTGDSEWFMRPTGDDKSFSGTVKTFDEIRKMAKEVAQSNNPYLTNETLILVSSPKEIEKEWRHFIVGGEVVSSCRYMLNGSRNSSTTDVPAELLDFVKDSCAQYMPHDIFVIDTALCDEKYSIIECNCFNDTGFYDHDIIAIIRAVNQHLKTKTGYQVS